MDEFDRMTLRTAILYQSEDVSLIDLPTSIALAQNASGSLLSTTPNEVPFLITQDPKTERAKAMHAEYVGDDTLHQEYKFEIEKALAEIRRNVSGRWCLPRAVSRFGSASATDQTSQLAGHEGSERFETMVQTPGEGDTNMKIDDPERGLNARLREWCESKGEEESFDFEKMMASLGSPSETDATLTDPVARHRWLMSCRPAREIEGASDNDSVLPPEPEPWTSSFHNSEDHALQLTISDTSSRSGQLQEYSFRVPPRSTFFLNDVTKSKSFRASFRDLTSEYNLPRHFDFILMDPPWPSRSVKRKGNYDQAGGIPHMVKVLRTMEVETYLEHDSLLGVWVTNSPKQRQAILGPGGLFEQWNVSFFEEWIWVKTTAFGEPMFRLDTLWRKPYEALLLARAAPNSWTTMEPASTIKRKVIAAVPDIHSRKPCLKELIEPYLPNDYNALEIFPRNLVAGWTSWGNEVLKYNWDNYWVSSAGKSDFLRTEAA